MVDQGELVAILETTDPTLLPVIKSILRGAGILFTVQGEEAMSLLPVGELLGPFARRGLAARVLVKPEDEEVARGLLQELEADAVDTEE